MIIIYILISASFSTNSDRRLFDNAFPQELSLPQRTPFLHFHTYILGFVLTSLTIFLNYYLPPLMLPSSMWSPYRFQLIILPALMSL